MKSVDPMLRLAAAFSRAGLNCPWSRINARVLSLGLGGNYAYAQRSFGSAVGIKQMLMPSERNDLTKQISALKELETRSSFMRGN